MSSRQSSRRLSKSGRKRKMSEENAEETAEEKIEGEGADQTGSKSKKVKPESAAELEGKESSAGTESNTHEETLKDPVISSQEEEPAQDRTSASLPGFTEAQRRAVTARRKLDRSIRQRQSSINLQKSLVHLRRVVFTQLQAMNRRLQSCEQSSHRIEEDLGDIKAAMQGESRQRGKVRGSYSKLVKAPRPHTVVLSVPDQPGEGDDYVSLKVEEQKGEDKELHVDNCNGESLIVDQKEELDSAKDSSSSNGNFTFITLNAEEDYPNGSWLGDESNAAMRVRCAIPPTELVHIMNMYKSAEKLALKLLDLLFDKETQATSNLSGTGRHNKKKLDPLLVYGIHCHLVKYFGITNEDWYRIRHNIDSKCRTAFRRKQKGLDLYPKHAKKAKRVTHFTTQDFPPDSAAAVQELQQVVNHLQALPAEGLTGGITIIRETVAPSTCTPSSTTTATTTPNAGDGATDGQPHLVASHAILHDQQGTVIEPDQLKELINQAGAASEIHLSTGQTITISQSGELEIREVQVEEIKA